MTRRRTLTSSASALEGIYRPYCHPIQIQIVLNIFKLESIMSHQHPVHPPRIAQRGITLIESLIALLILCLGVLGLAQVEARMMVETRTTNARATAIQLIADLGERIRINDQGAQPIPLSVSGWGFVDPRCQSGGTTSLMSNYAENCVTEQPLFAPSGADQYGYPPDPQTCTTYAGCDPTSTSTGCASSNQLPSYDVCIWKAEVESKLKGQGRASIQQVTGTNQLRVIIAWPANENTNMISIASAPDSASNSEYEQVAQPLQITDINQDILCNPPINPFNPINPIDIPNWICYVDFIDIPTP
jgi:type II secretory pathway pseudopilin PulG